MGPCLNGLLGIVDETCIFLSLLLTDGVILGFTRSRQHFWDLLVLIMKLIIHIDFPQTYSHPMFDAMSYLSKPKHVALI